MSSLLINLKHPDIVNLSNDGYTIEIDSGYLIVKDIPYVNSEAEVKEDGILICSLDQSGQEIIKPNCHTMYFCGEYPCDKNGKTLEKIRNTDEQTNISSYTTNFRFSSKPKDSGKYDNYYHKITTYANIISSQAEALKENITAKKFRPILIAENEGVLNYYDTNSSRAGITNISKKLEDLKIGIVGLGGTGSYILDFVSKSLVKEIHLFDNDTFDTHNAFRSPSAPSIEKLNERPNKVDYFKSIYLNMHKNIYGHKQFIDETNINELYSLDFLFISIDNGEAKKIIIDNLLEKDIPFVDVGLGIRVHDNKLDGIIRTTSFDKSKKDHINKTISFSNRDDVAYVSNIQISELNAFNAVMAVIKWKKYFGVYNDDINELHSVYEIGGNMLDKRFHNDET